MDSSGLNVLVSAVQQSHNGDSVRIRNAPIGVQRVLSITGLDGIIRVVDEPPDMRQSAS